MECMRGLPAAHDPAQALSPTITPRGYVLQAQYTILLLTSILCTGRHSHILHNHGAWLHTHQCANVTHPLVAMPTPSLTGLRQRRWFCMGWWWNMPVTARGSSTTTHCCAFLVHCSRAGLLAGVMLHRQICQWQAGAC